MCLYLLSCVAECEGGRPRPRAGAGLTQFGHGQAERSGDGAQCSTQIKALSYQDPSSARIWLRETESPNPGSLP
eukprot:8017458-Pyramimonas_sp.AAC.1